MTNESISTILSRRINAMGLSKQFNAARVCAVANEVEKGRRPEGSAQREFEAVSYKNSVLKVRVDSGARAHLIKLREKEILASINTELKREVVKRIVFNIE